MPQTPAATPRPQEVRPQEVSKAEKAAWSLMGPSVLPRTASKAAQRQPSFTSTGGRMTAAGGLPLTRRPHAARSCCQPACADIALQGK